MSQFLRLALAVALFTSAAACGGGTDTITAPTPSLGIPFSTTDLVVGTGAEALNGRRVVVNYTGWLYVTTTADNKGTQFDTGNGFVRSVLGGGGVIVGFDRGIIGMRVGGRRRVVIPPELGYGSAASGAIPGNATLIFELELISAQ
ncbi:MAG: FKBP-type peptidyl-prolyl cis-trans isomerase [Acidobacteriota bacterium]